MDIFVLSLSLSELRELLILVPGVPIAGPEDADRGAGKRTIHTLAVTRAHQIKLDQQLHALVSAVQLRDPNN